MLVVVSLVTTGTVTTKKKTVSVLKVLASSSTSSTSTSTLATIPLESRNQWNCGRESKTTVFSHFSVLVRKYHF
jgi:hypothetical protein